MKLINKLNQYQERFPPGGENVNLGALIDVWAALPKLLAFVEAFDAWEKLEPEVFDREGVIDKLSEARKALDEEAEG